MKFKILVGFIVLGIVAAFSLARNSDVAIKNEVITIQKDFQLERFCFDTAQYKSVLSWSFNKVNGRLLSAVFYKRGKRLELSDGKGSNKTYENVFFYSGLGAIQQPYFDFERNTVISISQRSGGQSILLTKLSNNEVSKRIYTLPEKINGLRVKYLNEYPLIWDESTVVLRVFYPDNKQQTDVDSFYKGGVDVVLKLPNGQKGEAQLLFNIGHYPDSYKELDFVVQDLFPQRVRVAESIFYSFKNDNQIIRYDLSDLNSIKVDHIVPSNEKDIEPIKVKMSDFESDLIERKLSSEPGFLSLKYLKEQNVFLRVYKPRIPIKASNNYIPLYYNRFQLFVYDQDFNLLKQHEFEEKSYRSYLMGDNNFTYLQNLQDTVSIPCQFYEFKL